MGVPLCPEGMGIYHRWHSGKRMAVHEFELGVFPVTVGQYSCFRHDVTRLQQLSENTDRDKPIGNVSWDDARAYCAWLFRKTGKAYRLPTDAEWEYAARGGRAATRYPWGDELDDRHAWYGGRSGPITVGTFEPNGFGFYDMTGNVLEWCEDRFNDVGGGLPAKNGSAAADPADNRVLRGGSFLSTNHLSLWIAYRHEDPPDTRHPCIGFRVARSG